MKQSVVAPGRLASAHSVRTGRRNSAGIAEKTSVGISFGGVSRYIIFLVHPCWNGRTIDDVLGIVDCPLHPPRHCEPTGRANARPMTGSAKQSILLRKERMDCFGRSAP